MAKQDNTIWWVIGVIVVLVLLVGGGIGLFGGGKDIELSEYKNKILSWDSPTTYSSWELMSNPQADYISIGDRMGSYITIVENSNCERYLNEMVSNGYIIYKEDICEIKVFQGREREPSTATSESEYLCSSDNKFVVSIRPKDSPIKDKYFGEFVC